MIIILGLAAFVATFLGGYFALKLKDKLHLVLGFSAGAVIAVAFFDLIPEALELGAGFYETSTIITVTAIGFLAYLVLDRIIFLHGHAHEDYEDGSHPAHHQKGILPALSLCFHSLLDGVAIGLAFQVSITVGIIVAVAVLVHDFSDGINTVSFILRNNSSEKNAKKWLIADAAAPIIGIIITLFFTLSQGVLSIILALFAGFFLYIGASDLIPESHHAHPKFLTTVMTILGAIVLYIAIGLAGI